MSYENQRYLAHHGIRGQKWGHKSGPPYPLDASDHSASEKKAGWRKSLEGASDEKKAKIYQKRLNKIDKSVAKDRVKIIEARNRFRNDLDRSTKAKTDEKKDRLARQADDRYFKSTEKSVKRLQDAQRETDRIIKELTDQGFSVQSRDVDRYVVRGRDVVAGLLLASAGVISAPSTRVSGIGYEVTSKRK